ncbi:MAG: hypothetical protein DHS20C15_26590 [Planctomycetota bacterium]|nr:MAG: hypothetical protein DHS20C15_26590 [Planctomycetota bacterium]
MKSRTSSTTLILTCSLALGTVSALNAAAIQDAGAQEQGTDAATPRDDTTEDTASDRVLPKGEQHALDNVTFELGNMPVHVVSLHEDSGEVAVEFLDQPGSRATVQRDQLPREVRYRIMEAKVAPENASEWERVAAHAQELELRLRRFEALQEARAVSEGVDSELEARFAEAREALAAQRVERARELRGDGNHLQALKVLDDTASRYTPADSADYAAELSERWQREADGEAEPSATTTAAGDSARKLPDVPVLHDAADAIVTGRQALERSRSAADDTGEQREQLEASVQALREARSALGGASDATPELDPESEAEADEVASARAQLRRTARDLLVHAHLQLGYLELHLDDERSAHKHASLAAALDPEDPAVSDLRVAIAAHDAS